MMRFMNPNMYFAWMMAPMNPAMYQPMMQMADPNYYTRWMTAMMNPVYYEPITSLMNPNWYVPRINQNSRPQLKNLRQVGRVCSNRHFSEAATH